MCAPCSVFSIYNSSPLAYLQGRQQTCTLVGIGLSLSLSHFSQFGGHDNAKTNNVDYGEPHDNVDEEYRLDFSKFRGHDNAETTNVDHGEPHKVDAKQV